LLKKERITGIYIFKTIASMRQWAGRGFSLSGGLKGGMIFPDISALFSER
jgi:hypothetical protein